MAEYGIGILSFNHPELTKKCVTSVLKSGFGGPIFLFHNGSGLETVDKLRSLFPDIQHVEIAENKGFADGANRLIEHVLESCDWILFTTNDCELLSLPTNMPRDSGIYSCQMLYRNSHRVSSIYGEWDYTRGKLTHAKNLDSFGAAAVDGKFMLGPKKFMYIPGAAFWLDQATWRLGPRFDTELHSYWEDVKWSLEMQMAGVKLGISMDTKLTHAGAKTTSKNPIYSGYYFPRNRWIITCWAYENNFVTRSKYIQACVYFYYSVFVTFIGHLIFGRWSKLQNQILLLKFILTNKN